MISNVAPDYHWGVTKNQFVFVLNLFCKEYFFGQVQFLYLVWVCVHFACRAKEDTHIFMANCPSWRIRSLAHSHPGGLQLLWIKMNGFKTGKEPTDIPTCCWLVVSNIFYFHPYLGTWSNLTNIFQRGWNHQLEKNQQIFNMLVFLVVSARLWVTKIHLVPPWGDQRYRDP